MKKIALLLVALLLLGSLSSLSACSTDKSGLLFEEYVYQGSAVGYLVAGRGESTATDLVIPEKYRGKPVMGIGTSAFENCKDISSVTLPDSISSIGIKAFKNCSSLKSINTPADLQMIAEQAFAGCTALESFDIPDGIQTIGPNAFSRVSFAESDSHFVYVDNWAISLGEIDVETSEAEFELYIREGTVGLASSLFRQGYDDEYSKKVKAIDKVYIPSSVKHIAMNRNFAGIDIKYDGTMAEWKAIAPRTLEIIIITWSNKVICSDGEIVFSNGDVCPY